MAKVYILIDPLTEEIRYVGWTVKPLHERLRSHLRERQPCHRKWWIQSLSRVGVRPRIQLLQEVPDPLWAKAERYWIDYFRKSGCPLTNGTDGGEGKLGYRTSPETKAKLRAATLRQFASDEARQAVSQVHSGKTISDAHRKVVGDATRSRWEHWRASGAITSDETRAKISAARKGKPLSEETRAKISAYQKGRPKSPEHRKKLGEARRARASFRTKVPS